MKILFLDCDGVLSSIQSEIYFCRLETELGIKRLCCFQYCPIAMSNLKVILNNIPDMNIVVSSVWRKHSMNKMEEYFKDFRVPWERVIGVTPILGTSRGLEIQAWLDNNTDKQIEDFVILDDDADMEHLLPKLVKTNNKIGLSLVEVEEIVKRFTGQDPNRVWDPTLKG